MVFAWFLCLFGRFQHVQLAWGGVEQHRKLMSKNTLFFHFARVISHNYIRVFLRPTAWMVSFPGVLQKQDAPPPQKKKH